MAPLKKSQGQAAVETALTVPALLFAMLGTLQLTIAYHAKLAAEYAAFKAVRAGSVYRANCAEMRRAALVALIPTMPNRQGTVQQQFTSTGAQALLLDGMTNKGTPSLWLDYTLENANHDFDEQLEPDSDRVQRLRVKLAYFFEYRIPFVNWVMTRYWLAVNMGLSYAVTDPTMPARRAAVVVPVSGTDPALVSQTATNMNRGKYTTPIVASWSMRMMSDPLSAQVQKTGDWKCK
jgi:hypothetical protein